MPYQIFSFCIKLPSLQLLFRLMLCASKSQSTFSTYINKRDATTISGTFQIEHITHRDALLFLTWHGQFLHYLRCFLHQDQATQCLQCPEHPSRSRACGQAVLEQFLHGTMKGGQTAEGNGEAPSEGNRIKSDDRTMSKCLVWRAFLS